MYDIVLYTVYPLSVSYVTIRYYPFLSTYEKKNRTTISAAEFYPDQRKVIQYVEFADGRDSDGHGTHVAGIAAGKVSYLLFAVCGDPVV